MTARQFTVRLMFKKKIYYIILQTSNILAQWLSTIFFLQTLVCSFVLFASSKSFFCLNKNRSLFFLLSTIDMNFFVSCCVVWWCFPVHLFSNKMYLFKIRNLPTFKNVHRLPIFSLLHHFANLPFQRCFPRRHYPIFFFFIISHLHFVVIHNSYFPHLSFVTLIWVLNKKFDSDL